MFVHTERRIEFPFPPVAVTNGYDQPSGEHTVRPRILGDYFALPIQRLQRELLRVQLHRLDSRALFNVHLLEAVVRKQRPIEWCAVGPGTPCGVCSGSDGNKVRLEVGAFTCREEVERVFLAVLVPRSVPVRVKWYRGSFVVVLEQGEVKDAVSYLRRED